MSDIPPEKRSDPATIQNMMRNVSEVDRKVIDFLFTGRQALENIMVNDLLSCKDFLQSLGQVKQIKLGVTGFCMRGGLTYQVSTLYPFSASVPFYGASPKQLDSVAKINGPVFGIYAGEDDRINSSVPSLVEAMFKHRKAFEMKIYKGAQHSFFNETRPTYQEPSGKRRLG